MAKVKLAPTFVPRDEAAKPPRSKEARTRGANTDVDGYYRNRPAVDTPGFGVPVHRRWRDIRLDPDQRREIICEAYIFAEAGMTDFQIAKRWGIDTSTLYRWRVADPRLDEALKTGAEHSNMRVEASLYHKAMGYSFDAVKIMNIDGQVVKVPYVEHIPPDNTAMVFWLKNKAGWRDQVDVNDVTPPSASSDIRQLAMAMMLVLRQGMNEAGKTIDLEAVQQQAKELTK